MDEQQRAHVRSVDREFARRLHTKYSKGAEEHGGYIWDQTLLQLTENAMEECVDQFVYLATLRELLIAAVPDQGKVSHE